MANRKLISESKSLFHLFSTKKDHFSFSQLSPVNFSNDKRISFFSGNIKQLAEFLNIDPSRVIYPIQSHEDRISFLSDNDIDEGKYAKKLINTDALITNCPNLFIGVKTADCVPILLADPKKNIIAAVHSGWRGTALNIVGKTVREIINLGSSPENIIALIGPSIGMANYPVGMEVVDALKELATGNDWYKNRSNKFCVDLKKVNQELLLKTGVKDENIDVSNHCTFQMSDDYYSARRDGTFTGRMLNGIMLKV